MLVDRAMRAISSLFSGAEQIVYRLAETPKTGQVRLRTRPAVRLGPMDEATNQGARPGVDAGDEEGSEITYLSRFPLFFRPVFPLVPPHHHTHTNNEPVPLFPPVEVPTVAYPQLTGREKGTNSSTMRSVIKQARDGQIVRNPNHKPNSALLGRELNLVAALDDVSQQLMRQAMNELGLSARAYDKVRRVARTIADLNGDETIKVDHVSEAIQYRLLDRRM